jgi:hypothetical protein
LEKLAGRGRRRKTIERGKGGPAGSRASLGQWMVRITLWLGWPGTLPTVANTRMR